MVLETKALELERAEAERLAWDLLKDVSAQFHDVTSVLPAPEGPDAAAQRAVLLKAVETLKCVIHARECCNDTLSALLAL